MIRIMDLFDSPILGERKRLIRKLLRPTASTATNIVIQCLVVLLYLVLGLFAFNVAGAFMLSFASYALLVLICFLTPTLLHSSIAGEREKRTWDFLAVAPLTPSQIVLGKFAAGMTAIFAITIAALPFFLTSAFHREDRSNYSAGFYDAVHQPGQVVYILLTIVTFSMALAAFSVFISTRSRRAFTAQGVILGSEILALLVLPLLIAALDAGDIAYRVMTAFSPFTSIGSSLEEAVRYSFSEDLPVIIHPFIPCAAYLVMTGLFLIWSERTIRFADNDVRFVKKSVRSS